MSRTKTPRKPHEIREDVKKLNALTGANPVHLFRPDYERALMLAKDKELGFAGDAKKLLVEGIEVRIAP